MGNIPPECMWLLEIDPDAIYTRRLKEQQHWLDAVIAARTAGKRAIKVSDVATSSWNTMVKDGKFSHLLSQTSDLPTKKPTETVVSALESVSPQTQ